MSNKAERSDRQRRGEARERQAGEPFLRDVDEERVLRSPDQEFETSAPYRQPRDPHAPAAAAPWSPHLGRVYGDPSPRGSTRTDDQIRQDIGDRLSMNEEIDASDVVVQVSSGRVSLKGTVETRQMKAIAEDLAAGVPGAVAVNNALHVSQATPTPRPLR